MKYQGEIGKCNAVKEMLRAVGRGRLSHAYLLNCEDAYTSKVAGAMLVAAMIEGGDAERVFSGRYADVTVFPSGDSQKVLVADIDSLTETAHITPTELDKKFYIIEKTETMTEAAQNKLLKTLEEAPPSAVIVLECARTAAMLPTVLSRCLKIDILPLDSGVIERGLATYYGEDERIYAAVGLSRGYFGFAERFMTEKSYYDDFRLALETLVFMKTSKNILTYSAKWAAKKDSLPSLIDCVSVILSDCMLTSVGRAAEVKLKSNVKEITELSRLYDYRVVARLMPLFAEAKRKLTYNCNAQSVIDGLLFSILEVKAKCQKSLE